MKIEFCIETETAAKAAQKFGADRIELCQYVRQRWVNTIPRFN